MKTIFISATMSDSGQSLVCWLLADELIKRGYKVGIFRPMGVAGPDGVDPLMKLLFELFGDKIAGSPDCPLLVDPTGGVDSDLVEFHLEKILTAFSELKNQCEICIAIGSRDVYYNAEQASLPDVKFIEMFDATVLLIDRFVKKAMTVYSSLALASFLRERLAGIIINRTPKEEWDDFTENTVPYLREKGVPILAVMPEDDMISSPTLMDLQELLDAEILCCEENLNNLAVGKTISADMLPKDMKIYKRVINKVLFKGASVENINNDDQKGICGILITGGRTPAKSVIEAAQKNHMPVMLTKLDTFAAIDMIDNAEIYIKSRDTFRLEQLKILLTVDFSIEHLLQACGI